MEIGIMLLACCASVWVAYRIGYKDGERHKAAEQTLAMRHFMDRQSQRKDQP